MFRVAEERTLTPEETAVVNWIAEDFKRENLVDFRDDPIALIRVAEQVRRALDEADRTEKFEIFCPFLMPSNERPTHLSVTVTWSMLKQMAQYGAKDKLLTVKRLEWVNE